MPATVAYTREQLLLFRSAAPPIDRTHRKILFFNNLWLPTRERSVRYEAYTKISPAGSTLPTCLSGETETGRNTDLHSGSTIKSMRNDNILIGCLNACSIRNKTAVLTNMLVDENLDLLAITESFHESADDVALKRITPDGYSALEKARAHLKGQVNLFLHEGALY
jgi:hypothetical protein